MAGGETATVEEKLGIRIERNPSEARLKELGVRSWPKWGCDISEFPWTYSGTETCYLLKGKVQVKLSETERLESHIVRFDQYSKT